MDLLKKIEGKLRQFEDTRPTARVYAYLSGGKLYTPQGEPLEEKPPGVVVVKVIRDIDLVRAL